MNVKDKGNFGEKLARDYICRMGLSLLETNYYSRFGEIDIIASDGKYVMFIEVKLRHENSLVQPSESVIKSKQKKIIKTAHNYILKHKCMLQPRFDVMEIKIDDREDVWYNYIENAFYQDGEYSAF